jgi:hypothetical protein
MMYKIQFCTLKLNVIDKNHLVNAIVGYDRFLFMIKIIHSLKDSLSNMYKNV